MGDKVAVKVGNRIVDTNVIVGIGGDCVDVAMNAGMVSGVGDAEMNVVALSWLLAHPVKPSIENKIMGAIIITIATHDDENLITDRFLGLKSLSEIMYVYSKTVQSHKQPIRSTP